MNKYKNFTTEDLIKFKRKNMRLYFGVDLFLVSLIIIANISTRAIVITYLTLMATSIAHSFYKLNPIIKELERRKL